MDSHWLFLVYLCHSKKKKKSADIVSLCSYRYSGVSSAILLYLERFKEFRCYHPAFEQLMHNLKVKTMEACFRHSICDFFSHNCEFQNCEI